MTEVRELRDDLDHPVHLTGAPQRVVSLVPSLTEAIEATQPGLIVGATDYCIAPADLAVTRVRGTKNPDRAAIIDLQPDLVIANREENREHDVNALRDAGVQVWVTSIDTVDGAFVSLRRLLTEALALSIPGWLIEAEHTWAPPPRLQARAALPIWRDPWLVVGGGTYCSDVLERIGVTNTFADQPRYPTVELAEIQAAPLVILPDEPYAFSPTDGPECFTHSVLVDGRATAWYGPSMVWARPHLEEQLAAFATPTT